MYWVKGFWGCVWTKLERMTLPPWLFVVVLAFLSINMTCSELNFSGSPLLKNLPAMQETQETQLWSLGREDPLEEGMTSHSNNLAWRIPYTEEPEELWSIGWQRAGHNWSDWAHVYTCSESRNSNYIWLWFQLVFLALGKSYSHLRCYFYKGKWLITLPHPTDIN